MHTVFPAILIGFLFRAAMAVAMVVPGGGSPPAGTTGRTRAECAEVLSRATPQLREGDLIFIRIKNVLYWKIAATSKSWESHVGILFRDAGGGWIVAESTLPFTKFTPLEKFLLHAKNERFMVRRVRGGLSRAQTQRLRLSCDSRMGKFYHLGFKYDSSLLYCSKFVYDTFLEATGQRIGRIETFREMFEENPTAPISFWRVWFWGSIPWNRRTVTTTSQLNSPNLVTVFDSEARPRK